VTRQTLGGAKLAGGGVSRTPWQCATANSVMCMYDLMSAALSRSALSLMTISRSLSMYSHTCGRPCGEWRGWTDGECMPQLPSAASTRVGKWIRRATPG
jgi:hypothetical protein